MNSKKISLFIILSIVWLQLFAQDTPVKYSKARFREYFTQANLMTIESFNDTALKTLLLLNSWDPSNANINYRIGQLYLKSTSEKLKAVSFLETAAPKASKNYSPDDISERNCPYLVYYLLGQAYHLDYRFDDAKTMYEKFLLYSNSSDVKTRNDIKRQISICNTAKTLVANPVKCTITNLGDSINSNEPDYSPVITADESELYFTSRRYNSLTGGNDNRDLYDNYYEDIWMSTRKADSTWSEAKPVSTHINSWYNEAAIGISADGQELLIYKDDKGGSIYYSRLDGDQWSYPNMIGTDPGDVTDINSMSWETSACFSSDGSILYFVSDRIGGFGGRDIYKCVKLPTGKWSKATNLGPTINTPFDEDAPFMHPDGVTMFFSSSGHETMGGFDIFFSTKTDSTWTPPINIGYPINTPDDDIFYVMSADGRRAYYASVRPGGKGEKDIYMVTLPNRTPLPVTLMKGYISFGGKDSLLSFVTITAIDAESGDIVQEVHPNAKSLKYILPLNAGKTGKTYKLKYEADGFRPYSTTIRANAENGYKEIDKNHNFKSLGTITISGKITTRTGNLVPETKISVIDNTTKKTIGVFGQNPNGTYSFDLPAKGGETYNFIYEGIGYLQLTESLELPMPLSDYDFTRNVIMETSQMNGTISVSGAVTDHNGNAIPSARIRVIDNVSGLVIGRYNPNKETGAYFFSLIMGNNYNVSYEAEGYLFHSLNINISRDKSYVQMTKDITLVKISKGAKIVLNNIFFDSGKSTLRKESNIELENVLSLLKLNPTLKIEIGGHTDNKGKVDANLKLSQQRADAVVHYLISNGIEKTRVVGKGYGDTQPLAPNIMNNKPNIKNMQTNRRVEFKILDN
ncbi:MAG TPA: OmpA family protein [Bacteroidia bacterium]|nr:OmpA family protein [Bacteroidia bacterium]